MSEALRLAKWLEDNYGPSWEQGKAAAELRRLHAELERCKQVCAATAEAWRMDALEQTGCDHCRSPMWCGIKCDVCGRKP